MKMPPNSQKPRNATGQKLQRYDAVRVEGRRDQNAGRRKGRKKKPRTAGEISCKSTVGVDAG